MKKLTMMITAMLLAGTAFCVATTHLGLDCRTGARTAGATERINFSPAWETAADGAAATVSVNGEVLRNTTAAGAFEWTPPRDGTYYFTHAVSVGGEPAGETLSATFVVGSPSLDNPVVTPASGTVFDPPLTVTMSCESEGATIHYTTNGTTPTTASPVYKRFKIYGKTTVKAAAFNANGVGSAVVVAEYALGRCANPSISPADGTVFMYAGQEVSIAKNGAEGTLRYTIDGTDPTPSSPVYAGPFTVDASTVVKAKVFSDRYFDSAVVSANLTREQAKVATPVIAAAAEFTGSEAKVVLSCATPGAQIRYTTDGNEPNSHSTLYTGPFWVRETCTVKAIATCPDHLASDFAAFTITKRWGIGDTMGAPDHAFATSGDAGFSRVVDASAPGGEAMRSGAIGNSAQSGTYKRSVLSTTVQGPGTLSFQWRSSCEQDNEYEWDHAEFAVDGVVAARINGVTGWRTVTQSITGAGEHVVTWTYLKDEVEYDGEDCVWVAGYSWAPAEAYTHESDAPVPYSWIRERFPHTADEYAAYEAAVKATAANGRNTVEGAYVAGLDPADASSVFRALVELVDGEVRISWTPNLNAGSVTRIYKVWGRVDLEKGDWETPVQPWHRFFKVEVAMPTGAPGETTAVAGEGFVPQALGGVQLWENGPYWAECNVGATKPEEYGYYFWWGDTVGYTREGGTWTDGYYYSGVTWVSSAGIRMGSSPFDYTTCPTYSKSNSELQSLGYIDSTGNLVAAHDAATAHLGAPWRMPTDAEFSALISNCDTEWTTRNGVYGRLVTGRGSFSTKSIFLPAAGYGGSSYLGGPGSGGNDWSSTPSSGDSYHAWGLSFYSGYFGRSYDSRDYGRSVRPVRGFAQ